MPGLTSNKVYLYHRIVQAKLYIDAHYADDIDVEDIADEACFSRYHFIRLFKMAYGYTPHQYLIVVRVKEAKLLLEKGLPVNEVSGMVGIENTSAFATLFKKYTSCSPKKYREDFLQRQKQIEAKPLAFIPSCFAYQRGWSQE